MESNGLHERRGSHHDPITRDAIAFEDLDRRIKRHVIRRFLFADTNGTPHPADFSVPELAFIQIVKNLFLICL